jgi:hypothetical protein
MVQVVEYSAEVDATHWMSILEAEEREKELSKFERGSSNMADTEELKAQVKKLNQQATALKMDLHDLSEDLPTGWEKILEVAGKAHQAYQSLDEARKRLAASGG